MWDEIIYPFPNFNGVAFEVCERMINFTPYHINGCNYLSMLELELNQISKGLRVSGGRHLNERFKNISLDKNI